MTYSTVALCQNVMECGNVLSCVQLYDYNVTGFNAAWRRNGGFTIDAGRRLNYVRMVGRHGETGEHPGTASTSIQ